MKKLIMTAAVLACAASIVSAQTVSSANMVGYNKSTIVGGQLTIVAFNFTDSSGLVSELIGDQLPFQSKLYVWDKDSDSYRAYTKGGRFAPGVWPADAYIENGEAVWVEAPVGSGTNELVFSGEVLMEETNTVTIATPGDFEMTGFYYPVDIAFGDTDLANQLPFQSKVHFWNGTGYDSYTKSGRFPPGVWSTEAQAKVIPNNGGFWIESTGTVNWVESRPFNP